MRNVNPTLPTPDAFDELSPEKMFIASLRSQLTLKPFKDAFLMLNGTFLLSTPADCMAAIVDPEQLIEAGEQA